jgi:predicted TIM-barrel fold metal-dependent hydrolase
VVSFGWRCVTLRPEMIMGRSLAHPDYKAFWAACEQHDVAVAFHGGTHLTAPTVGTDRFTSRFGLHACSHPMEAQMAFVSLLESGVFERHPSLRFAFLEAGASWVPHWLWRLDNICYPEFQELTSEAVTMLPSEYFKRQCWVAVEIEEPCLRQVVEAVGISQLLFGTDFPHPDHLHFDISNITESCPDLSHNELKAMLETNPTRFFGE